MDDERESPSVTITRLIAQLVMALVVLGACLFLVIAYPNYASGAALAAGMVLGAYFTPAYLSRRRDK